jgi:hypothetical protein
MHCNSLIYLSQFKKRLERCTLQSAMKFRKCCSYHITDANVSRATKGITNSNGIKINSDIQGHCCNNVISLLQKCDPAMALVQCYNVAQKWPQFTLLQQCILTMTLHHGSSLISRKNVIDMDGSTMCSSLTSQCKEHLKNSNMQYVTSKTGKQNY